MASSSRPTAKTIASLKEKPSFISFPPSSDDGESETDERSLNVDQEPSLNELSTQDLSKVIEDAVRLQGDRIADKDILSSDLLAIFRAARRTGTALGRQCYEIQQLIKENNTQVVQNQTQEISRLTQANAALEQERNQLEDEMRTARRDLKAKDTRIKKLEADRTEFQTYTQMLVDKVPKFSSESSRD